MLKDLTWTTFYGSKMKLSDLSQQHLSNILHYYKVVLEMNEPLSVYAELERRFFGIQLPYHPNLAFRYEIDELVKKGYTTYEINAPIVVNKKVIGFLKYN